MFSVPLIDFEEFMIRVKDMPRMIYQTRKALKLLELSGFDWFKKSYQLI